MRLIALALLAFLGTSSMALADDALLERAADLKLGMTADEVSNRLLNRKPERVVRQIFYRRHLEQWLYDNGNVRLEFDCRPHEEPRLRRVDVSNKN